MKTIALSLIEKWDNSPARVLGNIVADTTCYAPPEGLLVAGFKYAGKTVPLADGSLDIEFEENLVDTAVSWSTLSSSAKSELEKTECVLEIDYKEDVPLEALAKMATQGEFSLSLMGWDGDPKTQDAYLAKLKELGGHILNMPGFNKRFYPFSINFETIFLDLMGRKEDAENKRNLLYKGLVDIFDPAAARLEYALRYTPVGNPAVEKCVYEILLGYYGSEQVLEDLALALAKPITKRITEFGREIQEKSKHKVYTYAQGASPEK